MEEVLIALLLGDAALGGLVAKRINWLKRPQAAALPAIVLQNISAMRGYTLAGADGLTGYLVQIDAWASSFTSLKAVERALKALLSGAHDGQISAVFIENQRETVEPADGPTAGGATDLYRTSLDCRVWFSEP
jgi:hypothetical protein